MRNVCFLACLAAVVGGGIYLKSATPEVRSGSWAPSGAMTQARTGAAAVRLPDGRVLIAGGTGDDGVLATAELFSATGSFSRVAAMAHGRSQHVAVPLDDSRVLVTGGKTQGDGIVSSAEIYDLSADAWLDAGFMNASRTGHTATLLPDGRVLIAGGEAGNVVHTSLEIFDPVSNRFETLGVQLNSPRTRHGAALLPDGRVLLAGGFSGGGTLQTTDIFDPREGTLSRGPDLLSPREDFTATTLLDGKVLIAGGSLSSAALTSAEIFDSATGKVSTTGPMTTARRGHLAFLLPNNNRVLLVGGDAVGSSAELFTPWHGAFHPTGNLAESRAEAVGAPVGLDGALVLAGGRNRALNLDSSRLYRFATIRTEGERYSSDGAVVFSGSGWQPGEAVRLLIQEFPKKHEDRALTATADAFGNVTSEYKLDSRNPDAVYYVTANGSVSEAQFRFASGANLDQCANGTIAAPNGCTTSISWVNGNVNEGKAHYFEGDFLPYRMVMPGLASGSHRLTIQWDTTKGGKHALDYIGSFDKTEGAANPCAGVSGCSLASRSTVNGTIPADPTLASPFAGTQVAGAFTIFGGSIPVGGISGYTPSGSMASDSSNQITITFTAPADNSTVVLAWGGHIADHRNWTSGTSAAAITGSPFHTRLVGLDGSGGNQDRSLASGAVIFPASITVVKHANPAGSTAFPFTVTGGLSPASFSLTDSSASADPSQPFSAILAFTTYTVTESAITGWVSPPVINCAVVNPNMGSASTSGSSATIDVKEGEDWTCTYNNTAQATVIVKKVMVGGTDTFTYTGSPSGSIATNNGTISATITTPGTYTSTEAAKSGWDLTSIVCDDSDSTGDTGTQTATFKVAAAEIVTCTFTNTKQPKLTVVKATVPTTDTGTFNLQINGTTKATGGNGTTTNAQPANIGANTVGELAAGSTVLTDYTSSISCDKAGFTPVNGTSTSITLAAGDDVTCTITNTRGPKLTVKKATVPTTDSGTFDLQINGTTKASGGNGATTNAQAANIGSNTVGELAAGSTVLTDYTSSISCDKAGFTAVNGDTASVTLAAGDNVTCTITNTRVPKLTVIKATVPTTDTGTFNLLVNGATKATGGNTTTTNAQAANIGSNTVGETAAGSTVLTDYTSSISCNQAGFTPVSGASASITLAAGDNITCTITNTRGPKLTVIKATVPTTDTGTFNLLVNGATKATGGNTTTTNAQAANIGSNTVGEIAAAGTVLTDYTSSISCDKAGFASVNATSAAITLAAGDNVTCTITNTRLPKLTVIKATAPTTDTGTFNLLINGTTYATGGNGATTNAQLANIGGNTLGETAAGTTVLTDYTSSISCNQAGFATVNNTSAAITLAAGDNITCTITNTVKSATLILYKVCAPTTDTATSFNVNVTGPQSASKSVVCNGPSQQVSLKPGTYTVTEDPKGGWNDPQSGWTHPSMFANDCVGGSVSLANGETKLCGILNVNDACQPQFPLQSAPAGATVIHSVVTPAASIAAPAGTTPSRGRQVSPRNSTGNPARRGQRN